MNKKITVGTAVSLILLAVALCFQLTFSLLNARYERALETRDKYIEAYEKLYSFDTLVRNQYIGKIDDEALMDGILSGYMEGLGDKYGIYYSDEEYAQLLLSMKGQLVGIGVTVQYNEQSDAIEVIDITEGSPANAAGIMAGDCIIAVEGQTVKEHGYNAVVDAIAGKEGEKVTVTVQSPNGKISELVMTRAIVEYDSVSHRIYKDEIGIVQISEFNKNTPKEFKDAMKALSEGGIEKYIFDLRNNLGGDLNAICDVLDYILPEGPIVKLVAADGEETVMKSSASCLEAEICVLTNKYTASAAELFAAAVRDYEYGTVVGTVTYGKGTAQTVMKLPDGSGVRLSTEMYMPPYGENYEGVGVIPHVIVEYTAGENGSEDSQMTAAINILTEKTGE